ncbi:hypothetical protein [Lacrimispora sp. 38-1]|uniref:hypothetical protein n=1 Tax=Lacrimispora sp. 38-1 TaxID=3125778 RepID=UPI003CF8BAF6
MYIGKMETQPAKINIASLNRSAHQKYQALYGKNKEKEQTDDVKISPAGKKQSMLKQLMNQKQLILERKQAMLDSDQANGADSMNEKLKEYENQLKAIDEQIAQLQTDEPDDAKSDSDDQTGTIYKKPKSKEEANSEQLNEITKLSSGVSQTEVISSAKDHIDRKIKVLKSEIESGYGNTKQKIEDVGRLQSQSDELATQKSEKLGEINKAVSTQTVAKERDTETDNEAEMENELQPKE